MDISEKSTQIPLIPVLGKRSESDTAVPLRMIAAKCCVCEGCHASLIATGEDFEYRTSRDEFTMFECDGCGLVFLNPRPNMSEFARIYPDSYHAFEFSEADYGLIFKARRRLEANRLLEWCENLPDNAQILDVGCGDGFHLELLRDFGKADWRQKGVDVDRRAVAIGIEKGLDVRLGTLESCDMEPGSFDLVYSLQTIEHVEDPVLFLRKIHEMLKPGGLAVLVTDNTGSPDFKLFQKRHWGGYHFPRHWNLFNDQNLRMCADAAGFEVECITTQVSPVNWTYSIRNLLVDKGAPRFLYERFSLKSTVSLSLLTLFDAFWRFCGKGALLNARLVKPLHSRD